MKLIKKIIKNDQFKGYMVNLITETMENILVKTGMAQPNVPRTVEANGHTYVLEGYQQKTQTQIQIPEISSDKDKKLDDAEGKLVDMMTDNPTAGLVIAPAGRGKKRLVDMITKRLATIYELKQDKKPWNLSP